MAYNGSSDFSDNYSAGGAQATSSHLTLSAHDSAVDLPDNSFVRDADMSRDGMDLVLEGPGGTVVIEGYFAAQPAPNLVSPDGMHLTPNLVDSFLSSGSEYANAGSMTDESPVGGVSEVTGEATVTRVDGTVEPVTIGTPIYQGDVVETSGDGAVNIVFIDETEFAVSEDARLAIDEYVYDPSTQSGTQNFSVLKGVFVFTSGMIGRDDPDDVQIETPSGSIGIRGTIIAGDVTNGEITVLEGAIVVTDFGGNQVTLAGQFETARFNVGGGVENIGMMSAGDVAGRFSSVSNVAPSLFSSIGDAANDSGSKSGSSSGEGESKGDSGEGTSDGAGEGKAAGETPAEGAKAPAPQPTQTQASKGGFGTTADTATTDGAKATQGPAPADTRVAKAPPPPPPPADSTTKTITSEPIRPPLKTTTTTNDSNTDDSSNTTPPPPPADPNATFLAHTYSEIVSGATPPTYTVLAKIQVDAGSAVSASDFTFANAPTAFTSGNLRVLPTGTANVFQVVVDNTTAVKAGLDFDQITDLMQAASNITVAVRGETLNLGNQITHNITDVNENPFLKGNHDSSNGDATLFEAGTGDYIEGVPLEQFSASVNSQWSFDFKPLFGDPDFGRDSGDDVLSSGTQGNIAEQLSYKLSTTTVSALNARLGSEIVSITDGTGNPIDVANGQTTFNGILKINFGASIPADFNFVLSVEALDQNGLSSGFQNFKFYGVLQDTYIPSDGTYNFTTGNEVVAVNPGVSLNGNPFTINSSNNEIFFGNANDTMIEVGSSGAVTGNKLHLGGGDDITLIHQGSTGNTVLGYSGKDTINIQEAENRVYGMVGDDKLIFDASVNAGLFGTGTGGLGSGLANALYDGGSDDLLLPSVSAGGTASGIGDTLKINSSSAQTINFSNISDKIKNMEMFDLVNGQSETISLTRQDVIDMTDDRNTLILKLDNGGTNDIVNFNAEGSTFTQGQDITVNGNLYSSFSDGTVTLLINDPATNSTNVTGLGLPV